MSKAELIPIEPRKLVADSDDWAIDGVSKPAVIEVPSLASRPKKKKKKKAKVKKKPDAMAKPALQVIEGKPAETTEDTAKTTTPGKADAPTIKPVDNPANKPANKDGRIKTGAANPSGPSGPSKKPSGPFGPSKKNDATARTKNKEGEINSDEKPRRGLRKLFDLVKGDKGRPVPNKKEDIIKEALNHRKFSMEAYEAKRRRTQNIIIFAMAASIVLPVLVGGVLWVANGPLAEYFSDPIFTQTRKPKVNKYFDISGVRFGMTPEMVQTIYKDVERETLSETDFAFKFNKEGAPHIVWFHHDDGLDEVWKVRYQKTLPTTTLDEVLAPLITEHGSSYVSSCDRSVISDQSTCTYRWLGANGVNLTALIRRVTPAGGMPGTLLTMTAVDTNILARQRKAQRLLVANRNKVTFANPIDSRF